MQMRASGPDPLADFLFNVKSGHCEYFSTAMVVMLRTRGVAARVVNGFLPGEYNEAAGAFTVRQSDAHSWVEVYFPETRSWVTFDPTPSAGRTEPVRSGIAAKLQKYAEALELIWFQYVVGYDKQEQTSLAAALHNRFSDVSSFLARSLARIKQALPSNPLSVITGVATLILLVVLVVLVRRIRRLGWRRAVSFSSTDAQTHSGIDFYERWTALLENRGIKRASHLTPIEFAGEIGVQPALLITNAYNKVRYGGEHLTSSELREIESALDELETSVGGNK
jgi:hypothetical protein